MSRRVANNDVGVPAAAGLSRAPASPRPRRGSAWGRLPLGVKVLLPIFALTFAMSLGSAVFFSAQSVDIDRVLQAAEGKTIAAVVQGSLLEVPGDPASVGAFLHHVEVAYGNVAALCILTPNPLDPRGTLLVYASGGPPAACDADSPLIRSRGDTGVVSGPRQTAAGQVEETVASVPLSGVGKGAVMEVQVRLTPVAELALPTFEKSAGAGLLLALFQTAVVFAILWWSALQPLKELRMKASAAARSARPLGRGRISEPIRAGDEIHDLSQRFEEMLAAIRDRELELVESHDQLETLISNSPVIVFSIDSEGTLLQIQGNEIAALARSLGRESVVGMNLLKLVDRNAEFTSLLERSLAGEKVHEVVASRNWMSQVASPDPLHLDVIMRPTHDDEGRLIGVTGLAVNISDRMEAASARAESQQKSAFLAAMSHELRTPLNSIMGFSQLLEMPESAAALSSKQRRYVGHIHSSGKHLLALVSDILDLAKVGAGQMEVNLEQVALHDEVRDAVDKLRPLAIDKGLTIEMEIPIELSAHTDRLRVRQVLLNLLANAVKFTPREGGPVLVSGRQSGAGVELAVADSGIGIALDEQMRIFEEFTQVDRGPKRRLDGTGLGLTLTKRMIEGVGGTIRVDSQLGVGSIFTVWLPAGADAGEPPQLVAALVV